MANEAPTPLDADGFLATFADHFARKVNTKPNGTPAGALPTDQIRRYFTAEFGNLVDDMLLELRARALGAVRSVFTPADATPEHATLDFDSGRVHVRNARNSDYRGLQAAEVRLGNGVRIFSRTGTPEGREVAGRGSLCTDDEAGTVYVKTTPAGSTGWLQLATVP